MPHGGALQVVGQHGQVLGAIIYSVGTQRPAPPSQQITQRTQPQPEPETQQQVSVFPAAVREDDSTESTSAAHIQTASLGGRSQTAVYAAVAADAMSDATASQDSTALTAARTCRRTASKQDAGVPVGHGPQGTEALSSSLDDHDCDDNDDAESLIPSSSGLLPDTKWPLPMHASSPTFGVDACLDRLHMCPSLTSPRQIFVAVLQYDAT